MMEFARTGMGKRFFEATLPDLVRQVGRVANALEEIAHTLRAGSDAASASAPTRKEGR